MTDSSLVGMRLDQSSPASLQDSAKRAVKVFAESGCLIVEDVFPPLVIQKLRDVFMARYGLVREGHVPSGYKLDHERFLLSVDVRPPFSNPALFANAVNASLAGHILGPRWMLNSMFGVLSFPGSRAQDIHIDNPLLFDSEEISIVTPTYAFQLAIPLVDLDENNGGTRVWPGTHRHPHTKNGQLDSSSIDIKDSEVIKAKAGSVYLMDIRVTHRGEPNNSNAPRPILFLLYSLPWFRDSENFAHIPPLLISAEQAARIPEQLRKRLNIPPLPHTQFVSPVAGKNTVVHD